MNDQSSDDPVAPAQAAWPCDGDPGEGSGQRSQRAPLWQINRVVLDERCAVVCRNRTAILLPVEFHLRAAFSRKVMTGIRKGSKAYDRSMQFGTRKDTLGIYLVYRFAVWHIFFEV